MNANWNLPPGVSLRDIEGEDEEWEQCSQCEGKGHTGSHCCGEDVGDMGICPHCHEHSDNEQCSECNGQGEVLVET